jgi:hypothetical protein
MGLEGSSSDGLGEGVCKMWRITFPPQTVVTFHVLGWGGGGWVRNALFYPSIGRAAVQTLQEGKGHRRTYDWLLSKRGLLHCDVFNDNSNTTYVNIQNIHYTKPDASAYLVQVNWTLRILRKNFNQNMQSSILWLCSCQILSVKIFIFSLYFLVDNYRKRIEKYIA